MHFRRLLLGRPLANSEQDQQKLSLVTALPALGLDALSSTAYGPEAALAVLIPLGAAAPGYLWPLMLAILGLLVLLGISYRQTISAYPSGAGSYDVARANLGTFAGLLAATALMIDYILNVAVGISSGVGALVSALPALQPHILLLCLAVLLLITLANLRGTGEAGLLFSLPTYLFLAAFLGILICGLGRIRAGPVVAPYAPPAATTALSLWLILHAFAGGCTAMTGVEAVSNGVTAFKEPAVRNARRTLGLIIGILVLLLAGTTALVERFHIVAMDQTRPGYQSLLSQMTAATVGRGFFYYLFMAALVAVLMLSANTSFIAFPRLCRLLAKDDFLPSAFATMGRRLVYSVGVLFLAGTAAALLLVFDGITDRLIPLFAVGAFLAFSLSQCGMVIHWKRALAADPGHAHRVRLAINAVGAVATTAALGIILLAKFTQGAWIVLVAIPAFLLLLYSIRGHYQRVERAIAAQGPLKLAHAEPPVVVIPTRGRNRLLEKTLRLALQLSPDVIAVHISALAGPEEEESELRNQWHNDIELPAQRAGLATPRLLLLNAPYRRMTGPFLNLLQQLESEFPTRSIAVLIPELIKRHWWEHLLHAHRARKLRRTLLQCGGPRLIVASIPWYLENPDPAEALDPETDLAAAAFPATPEPA